MNAHIRDRISTAPSRAIQTAPALRDEVEQFLFRQSEMLDQGQWEEWQALFDPKGVYWIPADPAHTTYDGVPCICIEDRHLMLTRVKRLRSPKAWSQLPPHRTSHVVSNIAILSVEGDPDAPDGVLVQSRFHMVELRWDKQRYMAGRYRHELVRGPDGDFRIMMQRVDMLNYDSPMDYVLQSWL